jgi:transporter family-2 protein
MFSFVIAGQLLAAILFDHFGLLGYQAHPVSVWRVLGILLVVAGAIIILKN